MLRLRIIGEGPRDEVCLPPLLERLLECRLDAEFKGWRDFRFGRPPKQQGLGRLGKKLLFAIIEARDLGMSGIVATIDYDTGKEGRLKRMQKAREHHRKDNPAFPTALGQPKPHFEAWLLDDAVAVRAGLGLSGDHEVPNPVKVDSPKAELSKLFAAAPAARGGVKEVDVLPKIAECVDPKRCPHKKATGFASFRQRCTR